ncbi:MAG: sigma-70 family RNA polymerase sigma factor [Pyrinomonadaceae bacterium]
MTDNLSNNTTQRIFSAETPPKLSANYERLPEIERQIEECLRLSKADFTERLSIIDRQAENFLREETLICLLSLAHSEKLFRIENLICERLFAACEKRIGKVLRNDSFDANFIEDAVGEIRIQMLRQVFERTEKSYDFWEVLFYKALSALISAYRRKHAEKYHATALFSELSNDDGTDYENRLIDDEDFFDKKEKLLTSRQILAQMPKDLRQICILYYQDEETQGAIAEILGVTARTVRNKLRHIEELFEAHRKP